MIVVGYIQSGTTVNNVFNRQDMPPKATFGEDAWHPLICNIN